MIQRIPIPGVQCLKSQTLLLCLSNVWKRMSGRERSELPWISGIKDWCKMKRNLGKRQGWQT